MTIEKLIEKKEQLQKRMNDNEQKIKKLKETQSKLKADISKVDKEIVESAESIANLLGESPESVRKKIEAKMAEQLKNKDVIEKTSVPEASFKEDVTIKPLEQNEDIVENEADVDNETEEQPVSHLGDNNSKRKDYKLV